MANIFKEQKAVNEHPKRNNFDLSKKSNVSLKFGTLYPVYCQPVIPGDSFSIETAFNLKLLPVVFPVQTKMRAHMHFFYVRNKNLWSNWENWISNLVGQSEHPHPYISAPDTDFKNGSIHDFLGVPTSLLGKLPEFRLFDFTMFGDKVGDFYSSSWTSDTISDLTPFSEENCWLYFLSSGNGFTLGDDNSLHFELPFSVFSSDSASPSTGTHLYLRFYSEEGNVFYSYPFDLGLYSNFIAQREPLNLDFTIPSARVSSLKTFIAEHSDCSPVFVFKVVQAYDSLEYESIPAVKVLTGRDVDFMQYSDANLDLYSNHLHINALPYRAYESIYYCYYNNNVLNPLKINGVTQYNRYNTNLGDGADTTNYHLFQRNYELDFLTSSLPSPQQGVAPLVGMTALGDITIEDENGITTAHADIDDDGTITKVVLTSPAASNEHARVAMNMASCGMSINDFRQTNALQRMLETNIRKGYRYMDFIAGHFGKEPEYRELDLPEFIGGFSRDVSVSTVVSNADTLGSDSGAALGEYGGYAQVVGGSNHPVRHYCDDFGFIIGILSVVPTPCYSQLLPKHMIAPDNFLNYPFPEFMQSGLMPITYQEVAPIQAYIDSIFDPAKRLEDTFGYQRPNYDIVSAVDELHGEFRGSLKDYVINRIFDSRPELGQDFVSINPSEINDIFVDRNPDEDTIIGEIGFSVHAKRPVPRVVIPNLGR